MNGVHGIRRCATVLLVGLFVAVTVGYGGLSADASAWSASHGTAIGADNCSTGAAVAIVTGQANSPRAQLTRRVQSLVVHAFDRHSDFALIDDGSRPRLASVQLGSEAGNSDAQSADEQDELASITSALERVVPDSPQADPWDAVDLGLAWLRGQGGGTLVLEDSGLGTTGWLDYRTTGLLGANSEELVSYAQENGELPDARGLAVLLVGIGYTAGDQQQLDEASRANLVAQWTDLLEAAGACVSVDPTPLTGPAPAKAPPVGSVPVPTLAPPSGLCGETLGSTEVAFVVGTSRLASPSAAESSMERVVNQLILSREVVTISGTTSSEGGSQINMPLSLARANRVAQLMVGMGLPARQIDKVVGLGSDFPGYIPDTNAAGQLLPGPAAANRKVMITWRCNTN